MRVKSSRESYLVVGDAKLLQIYSTAKALPGVCESYDEDIL